MSRGKGFSSLMPEELKVLQAFSRDTIIWPVGCDLTDPQVKRILESLKRKGLVHRNIVQGLRITQKGKALRSQYDTKK
jgi:uncharacterized protein YjhX (UPF0386 family)